jgi:hypothetical protein
MDNYDDFTKETMIIGGLRYSVVSIAKALTEKQFIKICEPISKSEERRRIRQYKTIIERYNKLRRCKDEWQRR